MNNTQSQKAYFYREESISVYLSSSKARSLVRGSQSSMIHCWVCSADAGWTGDAVFAGRLADIAAESGFWEAGPCIGWPTELLLLTRVPTREAILSSRELAASRIAQTLRTKEAYWSACFAHGAMQHFRSKINVKVFKSNHKYEEVPGSGYHFYVVHTN